MFPVDYSVEMVQYHRCEELGKRHCRKKYYGGMNHLPDTNRQRPRRAIFLARGADFLEEAIVGLDNSYYIWD